MMMIRKERHMMINDASELIFTVLLDEVKFA